jgi:tetratricopeptide (TPR) repeat protein
MNIGSISSVVKLTLLTTLVAVTGCTTVVPEPQVAVETPETGIIEQKPAAPRRPHPNEYPVKNFEEDELYELLVAEVAGFRQDYEIALDTYVNIATLTRDPGVATRAAMLAAYLQRDEVALSLAKIWAEEDPDNIDAHRFIADLLMRVGDLEGAIAHMEEIKRLGGLANFEIFAYQVANLGDGDRTTLLAAISRMLEADDQDEQLLFSKAVLLEQNGDYEEALAIADRLLAKKKNVNVIILKVNALKDQDRNPDVVTFLEEMLIELPENRRLRLFYARFLFETDDLDGSRAQYELVLKDAPSDGDVLFALALIAFEQKDDVEAERHLLEMVRWSRRVGEAHFYLGSIAERRNDLAQAIREYKQVGTGYEFLPAQSRIASIMIEQGRVQEARDYLARLRAEEPERRDQLIMVEAQLLSERSLRDEVFDLLDTSGGPEKHRFIVFPSNDW